MEYKAVLLDPRWNTESIEHALNKEAEGGWQLRAVFANVAILERIQVHV